jgi:WD40 repeat protein
MRILFRSCALLAAFLAAGALGACSDGLPPAATDPPRIVAQLEREWTLGDSPGRQVIFSGDGTLLATSNAGGQVIVRRISDLKTVRALTHPGGATSIAFTPDRRLILTAGYDGLVRAWDLATGRPVRRYAGAKGTIWSLAISPDGSRLAAAGEDSTARVWPLDGSAPPLAFRGHERNIWEVRFSPDATQIATGSFDATARIWDVSSGKPLHILRGHSQAVVGLDYSPDGKTLATGGDDSTVRLWRVSDGALLRTTDNGNHAYKLEYSKDGAWLVSSGRARGALGTFWRQLTGAGGNAAPTHLWRTSDMTLIQALPHPDDVAYAAFSPNGRWLVTSGEDRRARLWRLKPAPQRR